MITVKLSSPIINLVRNIFNKLFGMISNVR